jgi:hypothetical protein
MTVAEMTEFFRKHGVPDWYYVTNGGLGAGECVGIEKTGGGWHVYYSEHGRKSPLATCATEDEACRFMTGAVGRMLVQNGLPPLPGV